MTLFTNYKRRLMFWQIQTLLEPLPQSKAYPSPQKVPHVPLQPTPPPSSKHWSALCHRNWICLFLSFHINGFIQYVLLCLASFTQYAFDWPMLLHVLIGYSFSMLSSIPIYCQTTDTLIYNGYLYNQTIYVEHFIIFLKTHFHKRYIKNG